MILPKTKIYTQLVTILILFLGIGTLVFGFIRIRGEIFGTTTQKASINSQNINDSFLALQQQDTDTDGLSDYEEIYLYKTSAYLADSDSDGISDTEEVKQGKNPLCPEGQNCQSISGTASLSDILGGNVNSNSNAGKSSSGALTPAQIRELLTKAGISETTLKGLDDATLLQLYQETVKSTGINPASGSGNVNDAGVNSLLSTLSTDQIRTILQQLTAKDPAMSAKVDSMSDAELRDLAAQILAETQNADGNTNLYINQ